MTKVRQDANAHATGFQHELRRLARIVRDRHRHYVHAANVEWLVTVEGPHVEIIPTEGAAASAMRGMYRQSIFPRQRRNTLHMVGMFMGDEDCAQIFRHEAKPREPLTRLLQRKATIDQYIDAA